MLIGLDYINHAPWMLSKPEGWATSKVKYYFEVIKDNSTKEAQDILSLTQRGIVVRDISNNEGQLAADYSRYNQVIPGDIVFNPMDLITGFVDYSRVKGLISPAYILIRPIKEVHIPFFAYYFQMHYLERIFLPFGKGVSEDYRWVLSDNDLLNFPIVIPDLPTQHKIADYLDLELAKQDKINKLLGKELDVLKKRRAALIAACVTGRVKV